jgi:hypothetical protein
VSMLRMNNLSISALDRKLIASLRLAFETEEVVSAAKVDEYKAKNPEIADAIQKLNDQLTLKKLPKYLPWGVKQLQANEDVDAVLSALDEFESLLRKKRGVGEVDPVTRKRASEPFLNGRERDIFFYKSLKDLTDKVEEAKQAVEERDVEEISKEEARKKIRQEGVEYIYHDADFLVARPLTKKASCHYGMGTKWCISDPERDYFEMYSKENRYFFFVIDRSKDASGLAVPDYNKPDAKVNDPWAKVAFVFEKGNPEFLQAWDTPDKQISIPRVLSHYTKEYGRKIYELIHLMYKSVESLPNTWQYDIKNSNDPDRIYEILKEHGEDNEDVRVTVAKNEYINADVQLTLAKDSSPAVRSALVRRTKPPIEEVQELLSKDPEEAVRAALAQHVSLFDKNDETKASKAALNLANDSSNVVVKSLVSQSQYRSKLPSEVLDIVLQSPVAKEVASSRYIVYTASTPQQLLRIIELNPNLAEEAAGHPEANDDVIEAALATGRVSDYRVKDFMKKLTLTPERLDKMLADPTTSMENRINLSKSEKATPEMLDRIASAGPVSAELAFALASNKNISSGLLTRLIDVPDEKGQISLAIAKNFVLTDELARALLNKEFDSPSIRRRVDISLAANDGTPAGVLSSMQSRTNNENDVYFEVRKELAGNNNTPSENLEAIAQQLDTVMSGGDARVVTSTYSIGDVYSNIVKNANTPEETRRRIVERVLSDGLPSSIQQEIAYSPLIPVDLLERLAKRSMWRVATGLAKNPMSTPEILIGVFNHYGSDVRRNGEKLEKVMSNPNFPLAKLLELAAKPGTRLGKHAKEVLKERPDRPAPPKRGRKPKAEPAAEAPMAVEEVVGVEATYLKEAVHSLAEIFHLLPVSAFALLAVEEAALLLEE